MTDLITQANIADDPDFKLRVRQAIIAKAMAVRAIPVPEDPTQVPLHTAQQDVAINVLLSPESWAQQIARSLATFLSATTIEYSHEIPDSSIEQFLDQAFAAYVRPKEAGT